MTPDQQRENPARPLPPLWARVVKYGIVVVTAVFYLSAVMHFDYTPDASYVSFRVASRVAGGGDFAFNPGQPSVGPGGPVWTLILATGIWAGLDAPIVAKTFDLVFSCLALFAVYFLAALILQDKIAAFFAALIFSVDAWVLRSSASGLGTSLALLLGVVTLWYGFRREYTLASLVNGVLVLSAPLEGVVLFAFMMVDAFAFWRRQGARPAALLRTCAAMLVPLLPWIAYAAFRAIPFAGDPTIVTFRASPTFGPSGWAGGELTWYAASGGIMIAALVLGHGLAAARSDWRLMAPSSFPLLWAVAAAALTLVTSPEGWARTWILVAPVVVIYGLLGLYYLSVFAIGLGTRSMVSLVAVVFASLLANQAVYRLKVVPEMNRTVVEMQEQVRPMAHWLSSRMGPDEILVAPFVGMIGWISGARVVGSSTLWVAEEESSEEPRGESAQHLQETIASGSVTALVDRSGSTTRLAAQGIAPVRSWSGAQGIEYTVYADSARRVSMLAPRSGTESGSQRR